MLMVQLSQLDTLIRPGHSAPAVVSWATGNSLVSKRPPPELCSVGFGDSEIVPLEETVGKDGFQFSQHVAEDQRQLGQVSPGKERRRTSRQ